MSTNLRERMVKFLNERFDQDGQVIDLLMNQPQEVEYPDESSPLIIKKSRLNDRVYATSLGLINTFLKQESNKAIKPVFIVEIYSTLNN